MQNANRLSDFGWHFCLSPRRAARKIGIFCIDASKNAFICLLPRNKATFEYV